VPHQHGTLGTATGGSDRASSARLDRPQTELTPGRGATSTVFSVLVVVAPPLGREDERESARRDGLGRTGCATTVSMARLIILASCSSWLLGRPVKPWGRPRSYWSLVSTSSGGHPWNAVLLASPNVSHATFPILPCYTPQPRHSSPSYTRYRRRFDSGRMRVNPSASPSGRDPPKNRTSVHRPCVPLFSSPELPQRGP